MAKAYTYVFLQGRFDVSHIQATPSQSSIPAENGFRQCAAFPCDYAGVLIFCYLLNR